MSSRTRDARVDVDRIVNRVHRDLAPRRRKVVRHSYDATARSLLAESLMGQFEHLERWTVQHVHHRGKAGREFGVDDACVERVVVDDIELRGHTIERVEVSVGLVAGTPRRRRGVEPCCRGGRQRPIDDRHHFDRKLMCGVSWPGEDHDVMAEFVESACQGGGMALETAAVRLAQTEARRSEDGDTHDLAAAHRVSTVTGSGRCCSRQDQRRGRSRSARCPR